MATRQPFWKRHSWKLIVYRLQPQRTRTWNLKLKFQSNLDLRSGNHAAYTVQKPKINMATRRPFWQWRRWKLIGFYPYTQVLGHWSFVFIFKATLQFGVRKTKKIQYGCQAAILKVTSLKINRLLPMATINIHMKFEIEIPKQTWPTLWKPCHLQSPETEISNMAARRLFWKWCHWKSIVSYPYS